MQDTTSRGHPGTWKDVSHCRPVDYGSILALLLILGDSKRASPPATKQAAGSGEQRGSSWAQSCQQNMKNMHAKRGACGSDPEPRNASAALRGQACAGVAAPCRGPELLQGQRWAWGLHQPGQLLPAPRELLPSALSLGRGPGKTRATGTDLMRATGCRACREHQGCYGHTQEA